MARAQEKRTRAWELVAVSVMEGVLTVVTLLTALSFPAAIFLGVLLAGGTLVLAQWAETRWHYHFSVPRDFYKERTIQLREDLRLAKERIETLEVQLRRRKSDQALADWLTDQVKYATTNLLNRQMSFQAQNAHLQFIQDVTQWKERVVLRMQQHGCTDQEIQSVEILVTMEAGSFDRDPIVNHWKSIVAATISRIQAIAARYAGD